MSTETLDLSQLFVKYGSDKHINGYTPLYHTLFLALKNAPVNVLEIGIGTMIPGVHSSMVGYAREGYKPGGSLRAWRDFFVNGNIHGADVQPDTQFTDESRITTHLCDSTKAEEVTKFFEKLNNMQFDIIIDDGSHMDTSQFATFKHFYPHLKEGGLYIIEDIYPGSTVSEQPNLLKALCKKDPFFFVGKKSNQCVIFKSSIQL